MNSLNGNRLKRAVTCKYQLIFLIIELTLLVFVVGATVFFIIRYFFIDFVVYIPVNKGFYIINNYNCHINHLYYGYYILHPCSPPFRKFASHRSFRKYQNLLYIIKKTLTSYFFCGIILLQQKKREWVYQPFSTRCVC